MKCIVSKTCTGKVASRRMCRRHYHAALRQVKLGRVTWDQLEARGARNDIGWGKYQRDVLEFVKAK